MPKLVIVRRIGSLPGESHYEVDTPMGTWQVDMVQYAAGSYEGAGYGTAPRWMVTTPGEDRPDSVFDRKRDAVAYITVLVDDELARNGGDAAQVAAKAHLLDELHADNSPWAKVAEQHTAPAVEEIPLIKETDAVTEDGVFNDEGSIPARDVDVDDEPGFCLTCGETFTTRATLDTHQAETGHELNQPDHPLHRSVANAYEPVDFGDVSKGHRLRFVTNDNGYGGRGIYTRTGYVYKVTANTVQVACADSSRATLRRSDWRARSVQRANG